MLFDLSALSSSLQEEQMGTDAAAAVADTAGGDDVAVRRRRRSLASAVASASRRSSLPGKKRQNVDVKRKNQRRPSLASPPVESIQFASENRKIKRQSSLALLSRLSDEQLQDAPEGEGHGLLLRSRSVPLASLTSKVSSFGPNIHSTTSGGQEHAYQNDSSYSSSPLWWRRTTNRRDSVVAKSNVLNEARMVIDDDDMLRAFKDQLTVTGMATGMATRVQLQEFMTKRAELIKSKRAKELANQSAIRELLPTLSEDHESTGESSSNSAMDPNKTINSWMKSFNSRAGEIRELIKEPLLEVEREQKLTKDENQRAERQRAAKIALIIGRLYADLGLTKRSVAVIDEALALWAFEPDSQRSERKELIGGYTEKEAAAFHESDLHFIMELKIEESKVLANQACNENDSRDQVKPLLEALAIYERFSSSTAIKNRSVVFPVFSCLFLFVKAGKIKKDTRQAFEVQLAEDFVCESELNGDPVHYTRALAMQAEVYAHLGRYEHALNVIEGLRTVYDIKYSPHICKAYGSDRSAQAFSLSALWSMQLGDMSDALARCEYVITKLLPHMDPKRVHNSACLLFPIIRIFKNQGPGMASRAKTLFEQYVLNSFAKYFKDGAVTPCLPVFKPLHLLLSLNAGEEEFARWRSDLTSVVLWAAEGDNGVAPEFIDSAMINFGLSSHTIMAELCLRLSKLAKTDAVKNTLLAKSKDLAQRARAKTADEKGHHIHVIAFEENERICEELDFQAFKSTARRASLPSMERGGDDDGMMQYWLQKYSEGKNKGASREYGSKGGSKDSGEGSSKDSGKKKKRKSTSNKSSGSRRRKSSMTTSDKSSGSINATPPPPLSEITLIQERGRSA